MTSLPLHVIEELLRLDDAGRLSKVCKVYVNGRIYQEYRAEPKVIVGGPCVVITYGYSTSNLLISTKREITAWTQQCQDDVDASLAPSGTGTPPGGIARIHDHLTVAVDDLAWVQIPILANRTTLIIQNNSTRDLLINSDNLAPLTEGISIESGEERLYEDTGPEVVLYLVTKTGSGIIDIEQLA